jgi:sugar O-acyltransferase (sialic acid O-acetyltransferase NeuD family)
MMHAKELILIGGGGHCKACIDVIEQEGIYSIKGILDSFKEVGSNVLGYEILGGDNDIDLFVKQKCFFLVTVGQVNVGNLRKKIFQKLVKNSAQMATVISPKAYVSKYAYIGNGTIIMHGAIVNADVKIGQNCIINNLCNIDHESIVGDNSHVSTCAVVNGKCVIGEMVMIGSGAVLIQDVKVGNEIVIGAGSVVIGNIEEKGTYVGNPVYKIK